MEQPGARRVMILSAGVGGGHNSAARALEAAFQAACGACELEMLDTLELGNPLYKALNSNAYFKLVEIAPWLVSMAYDVNDLPFRDSSLIDLWDQINSARLVKRIREDPPGSIVCTHFLPAKLISLLMERGEITTRLYVVTTDYDVQGLWLSSPFNHFFVAREETRAYMVDFGIPADRVTCSGIPVSAAFSHPLEREAVLQRHGLSPERPVLLISAGAAGSDFTRRIVEQTLRLVNDFQALVVCGRSKKLRLEMTELTRPRADRYHILGYSDEMPNLMRISALFVGKPGGLSSSECMAAGLPMVLVKPIPGQEERNADYLLEAGAAVRCNYDTMVGYKIDELLGDPLRLQRMAEAARRVGRPEAAQIVARHVLEDNAPPLTISHAAQAAIQEAAEAGESARYLPGEKRLVVQTGTAAGHSTGVFTAADDEAS